jgi:hypothetical protein
MTTLDPSAPHLQEQRTAALAHATAVTKRLRNPVLRQAYAVWNTARGNRDLPRLEDLDLTGVADEGDTFIASIDASRVPVGFQFRRVGAALAGRLADELTECSADPFSKLPASEALGSLLGAYRDCERTRSPSYEYVRYNFGKNAPVLFERLLMPLSANGKTPTTLVGIALFTHPNGRPQTLQ